MFTKNTTSSDSSLSKNQSKKQALVIVDAYNSGGRLVESFNEKFKDNSNTVAVHVQSTLKPYNKMAAPRSENYVENILLNSNNEDTSSFEKNSESKSKGNIVLANNINDIIESLRKYDVMAVFAGQEPGVELADILSEKLELKNTNGTKLSSARRNKYEMRQAISNANLAAPKFIKSNKLAEILEWVNKSEEYPVVVKALRSAGTDGVYICSNENELKKAFNELIGSETIYSETNTDILVESFLDGTEYVVNAVSLEGEHYVTDVGSIRKN